jgi:hypothetical protein
MAVVDGFLTWLQTWAEVLASVGSLLLSAFLVALYRQQKNILKKQTELTKATKEAVLRVEQFDFLQGSEVENALFQSTGRFESWRVHQDYFPLLVSNFGESPAIDIRLEVRIHYGTSGKWFVMRTPLTRTMLVPNQMAFNDNSGVLGADERNIFFVTQMSAEKDTLPVHWAEARPDAPETLAPSEVMYIASEAGESQLKVDMFLDYSDSTGEREPIRIHSVEFDPSDYRDFGSAIKQGTYLLD